MKVSQSTTIYRGSKKAFHINQRAISRKDNRSSVTNESGVPQMKVFQKRADCENTLRHTSDQPHGQTIVNDLKTYKMSESRYVCLSVYLSRYLPTYLFIYLPIYWSNTHQHTQNTYLISLFHSGARLSKKVHQDIHFFRCNIQPSDMITAIP